jgi:hypothetical protein
MSEGLRPILRRLSAAFAVVSPPAAGWRVIALLTLVLAATPGRGDESVKPPADDAVASKVAQPSASRTGRSRFIDAEDGQFDVSDFLAQPRAFLPIPIIVTEPAVGYGGGAVGMFLRPRTQAGEQGWARPDISAIGAAGTQNGTWTAFAGDTSHWMDGRLKTLAGAGKGRINLDFYGLGATETESEQKIRYSLNFTGAVAQANWQLAPQSPWSIGIRYVLAEIEPVLRDDPAFPGLTDDIHFRISAPSAIVEYDSRDNLFTPTRGVYAESSWMASRKGLGASVDFDRFEQVLIGWYPAAPAWTLGARVNYAWSSSGTPFFLRPYVVLRGVPAVRYQGDSAASAEAEVRWQFSGRWSAVAFGGAGRARTDRDAFSSTQNVTSGGVGFRYELARRFGLHVGMDIAHSSGTTAVYLQFGSAWFRP